MRPHVWLAEAEDADDVARLIGGFRDWWGKDDPSDEVIRGAVGRLIDDPATEYLLAASTEGDEAGGVCQLRYRLSVWSGLGDCWLEDLYVDGSARRAGLGRALVEASFERARERDCYRIELDVNEQNTEALAFYEALGFELEPKPPGRTLFIARKLDG
jgi:ribosomal protein S18 acetylase RimI-like enzyme